MAREGELELRGNPFEDPAVRTRLQAVIMDEIYLESASPITVRVPDRLISSLEAILTPYLGLTPDG